MKKTILYATIICIVVLGILGIRAATNREYANLDIAGTGSKTTINPKTGYVFKYDFIRKPKTTGQALLKITVTKPTGERLPQKIDHLTIKAHYGKPDSKGLYFTTVDNIQKGTLGGYLLPINFTATGLWQIDLFFYDAGKEIFHDVLEVTI